MQSFLYMRLSPCLFTASDVHAAGHAALVCLCSKLTPRHQKKHPKQIMLVWPTYFAPCLPLWVISSESS